METQAEGVATESENVQPVETVEAEAKEPEQQEANGEQESTEKPAEEAETAAAAEQEDEVVISIGEEPPPPKEEPAPAWVKELRKTNRELARKNKELEARLTATAPAPAPIVVGKKPTLEDSGYDADKFEKELASWYERKRKADEAEARARQAQEAQQKEWQDRLQQYAKAKGTLKVQDFEESEAFVTEHFSVTQQGILLQGAENPHYVVYALGKSQKKAKELAAITDPVKFAFAVAKLEAQLKVTSKKPAAAPEKPVSGTGRVSGSVDSTLERLRAEAEKTGNYSKVIAYKNSKRNK